MVAIKNSTDKAVFGAPKPLQHPLNVEEGIYTLQKYVKLVFNHLAMPSKVEIDQDVVRICQLLVVIEDLFEL